MNKELAKILTTALVQFIDRERPEGTMDCSNGECVSLEKAFTEENFDSVETLIKKKLQWLTEFELRLLDWLSSDTSGEIPMERMKEVVKNRAAELLALAKKELLSYADESNPAIEAMADLERTYFNNPDKLPKWLKDELAKKHLEGYIKGRADALREMSDFMESHFNSDEAKGPNSPVINIPTWTPPCYNGGPCTNPLKDCINCPRANVVISPNTASGTSTAKAEG